VFSEEGHDLAAHLQRHIGVEVDPVDAIELEADVAVSSSLMLTTSAMRYAIAYESRLCRPDRRPDTSAAAGVAGGLPPLSPPARYSWS
jgi:hypothetical protein